MSQKIEDGDYKSKVGIANKPLQPAVLRKRASELTKDELIERRIMPEELKTFNECFIVGSAAEVTPVAEIGPYTFKPGNISRALMDAYTNAVRPAAKAA